MNWRPIIDGDLLWDDVVYIQIGMSPLDRLILLTPIIAPVNRSFS